MRPGLMRPGLMRPGPMHPGPMRQGPMRQGPMGPAASPPPGQWGRLYPSRPATGNGCSAALVVVGVLVLIGIIITIAVARHRAMSHNRYSTSTGSAAPRSVVAGWPTGPGTVT
jgi:hypothetical protein